MRQSQMGCNVLPGVYRTARHPVTEVKTAQRPPKQTVLPHAWPRLSVVATLDHAGSARREADHAGTGEYCFLR